MSHLNANSLEKYLNFEKMHPVAWVSQMTPTDVVVMKHIILNSCLKGNTNLHGQRLVYPIKKHSHIRHVYNKLSKGKEHLMEVMMHKGGKGSFSGALKTVVNGVKTGLKAGVKAAKVTWKAVQKGIEFYVKHRSVIDKTISVGSTVVDIGASIGSAAGLWDDETAARIQKAASSGKSFATRDNKKDDQKKKTGKGQLNGYIH